MEAILGNYPGNKFTLQGPLNFVMRKFDIKLERAYSAIANHSLIHKQKTGSYEDTMHLITKAAANPNNIEYTKLLNFNLTEFRLQFVTKKDNLDQVMNEIRQGMTGLDELSKTVIKHESHLFQTTLMMVISLTSYFFQCLTTILFLSVVIREGHWRIFAPPAVMLNVFDPVNADIVDILSPGARMIIESQEYLIYAQLAFVTFLIILFLLTFVMKTWGKVQLTVHEGVTELPSPYQRFAGRLSFSLVRQTLTRKYEQEIQITFPLEVPVPPNSCYGIFSVDILHVFSVDKYHVLQTDRNPKVRFVDHQGYWVKQSSKEKDYSIRIEIPLDCVKWVQGGKPPDLPKQFYARATLKVVTDPRDFY
jgi:hypothetical protein